LVYPHAQQHTFTIKHKHEELIIIIISYFFCFFFSCYYSLESFVFPSL
jgi:hypothetical protein